MKKKHGELTYKILTLLVDTASGGRYINACFVRG